MFWDFILCPSCQQHQELMRNNIIHIVNTTNLSIHDITSTIDVMFDYLDRVCFCLSIFYLHRCWITHKECLFCCFITRSFFVSWKTNSFSSHYWKLAYLFISPYINQFFPIVINCKTPCTFCHSILIFDEIIHLLIRNVVILFFLVLNVGKLSNTIIWMFLVVLN